MRGAANMDLSGKRVVAIGERDGVNGPSLKLLAESAGASVVFQRHPVLRLNSGRRHGPGGPGERKSPGRNLRHR